MPRNKAALLIGIMIALSVLLYDILFARLLPDDLTRTTGRMIFILIFGGITELYIKKRNAKK
ncbi:hypothetical protein ACEN4L_06005 [Desemzia sp. FAM 23988]